MKVLRLHLELYPNKHHYFKNRLLASERARFSAIQCCLDTALTGWVQIHRQKIMCFGDSIVYQGMPEALQRLLDIDPFFSGPEPVVRNHGKAIKFLSREGTRSRWSNALHFRNPNRAILLEDTNDMSDNRHTQGSETYCVSRSSEIGKVSRVNQYENAEKEKTMIEVGTEAPDFTLDSHLGVPFRLADYKGKRHVMLVFYPLDWTPT